MGAAPSALAALEKAVLAAARRALVRRSEPSSGAALLTASRVGTCADSESESKSEEAGRRAESVEQGLASLSLSLSDIRWVAQAKHTAQVELNSGRVYGAIRGGQRVSINSDIERDSDSDSDGESDSDAEAFQYVAANGCPIK